MWTDGRTLMESLLTPDAVREKEARTIFDHMQQTDSVSGMTKTCCGKKEICQTAAYIWTISFIASTTITTFTQQPASVSVDLLTAAIQSFIFTTDNRPAQKDVLNTSLKQ